MQNGTYLPSKQFDQLLAMLRGLPVSRGVLPLNCEIPGHPSFFPGGRGYGGPEFPQAPVMFVGHNFDTDEGFRRSVARGFEDHYTMKTWVNMRGSFLPAARLDEKDCFFTNFYLGAIIHDTPSTGEKAKTTNVGKFRCSEAYRNACVAALKFQVEIVGPRVIALLGGNVPGPFGEAFSAYAPHSGGTMAQIQAAQPESGHKLQLLPGDSPIQVIALVHPANPRSLESHRAQGLLLRSALEESAKRV